MNKVVLTISVLVALVLASIQTAYPALTWNEQAGWSTEGGILEEVIGGDIEAKNALGYMDVARVAQEAGAYRKALRAYKKVVRNYSLTLFAPEALYQSGLIYKQTKKWQRAFQQFDRILKNYPDYEKYEDAVAEQYAIAQALQDGVREKIFGVFPGFRNPERAIEYYERLVANAPYSQYAPDALMNAAKVAREHRNSIRAIDILERLISEYPDSLQVADAYIALAETIADLGKGPSYDQGLTREALSYYEDYLTLYPGGENVGLAEEMRAHLIETLAQSKYLLGDYYYIYRNDIQAALTFYNEAITVAPNSHSASKAEERIAWIENGNPAPEAPGTWLLGPPKRGLREYSHRDG